MDDIRILALSYSDSGGGAGIAAIRILDAVQGKGFRKFCYVVEKSSRRTDIEVCKKGVKRALGQVVVKIVGFVNRIIGGWKVSFGLSISVVGGEWSRVANRNNISLVHLHWVQNEMVSVEEIGRFEVPVVVTMHDMWMICGADHVCWESDDWQDGYKRRQSFGVKDLINRWTWKRKKASWLRPLTVVCPSNWMAECVRKSQLSDSWRIAVIPNPIDTELWKKKERFSARQSLGVSQSSKVIIFTAYGGTRSYHKGYDLLAEALGFLQEYSKRNRVYLVVLDREDSEAQLISGVQVIRKGLISSQSEMAEFYSAADVMVLPSRCDNFPNTAVESLCCETPVVAFDIGGITDIIEHKISGYVAKPFDTKDLSRGIEFVLEEGARLGMGVNGRQRMVKKCGRDVVGKQYESLYRSVVVGEDSYESR